MLLTMSFWNYQEQKTDFENNHNRKSVGVYCDVNWVKVNQFSVTSVVRYQVNLVWEKVKLITHNTHILGQVNSHFVGDKCRWYNEKTTMVEQLKCNLHNTFKKSCTSERAGNKDQTILLLLFF